MKTVLISGAGGSLGRKVCRSFLENGWHVHAAVFSDAEGNTLTTDTAAAYPDRISLTRADLSREADVERYLAEAPAAPKALVHLVGGIKAGNTVEETSPAVFEEMLTLNLRTAFLTARAALPVLKQGGGAVVMIGARAAVEAEAGKSAYAVSKVGVVALSNSIAEEGKEHGVRSNCILPGIIRTAANLEWGSPEESAAWTPPEDIAQAVLMLCSDEGRGMSGAVIPMYGKL